MDVRYINPFIEAIDNTFKSMLQTEVTVGKPGLKAGADAEHAVFAAIDVSGDMAALMVLCFTQASAKAVAKKLAGTEEDYQDAVGEMINMVSGDARNRMADLSTRVSLPRIITGPQLLREQDSKPTLVIPCECGLGQFTFEVTMGENRRRLTRVQAPPQVDPELFKQNDPEPKRAAG